MEDPLTAAVEPSAPTTDAPADAPAGTQALDIIPGLEFMGCGYDVFEGVPNPKARCKRIYDLSQDEFVREACLDKSFPLTPKQIATCFIAQPQQASVAYRRPAKVGFVRVFSATADTRKIETKSTQLTSFESGIELAGSYLGFSGDLQAKLTSKVSGSCSSQVAAVVAQIVYWQLDLAGYGVAANRPPLSKPAAEDFAKQDTSDRNIRALMDDYGTHCIEKCGIGSRLVYGLVANTSNASSDFSLSAAISAAYSAASSAQASLKASASLATAASSEHVEIFREFEAAGLSEEEAASEDQVFDAPMALLNQGWHNPTLIDLPTHSLRGLWEVPGLMSPAMATAFKREFDRRAKDRIDTVNARFSGLRPLYLLQTEKDGRQLYKLHPFQTLGDKSKGPVWTNLRKDAQGRPAAWLLVSASQEPGMVPLYEYHPHDMPMSFRYETEDWIDKVNSGKEVTWTKTSDFPVGYVHVDGSAAALSEAYKPFRAFYHASTDRWRGVLYSSGHDIAMDDGEWTPTREHGYATYPLHIEEAERRHCLASDLEKRDMVELGVIRREGPAPSREGAAPNGIAHGFQPGHPLLGDFFLKEGLTHWWAVPLQT